MPLQWIELLKPVDGHDAGKCLQVEDNVASAYITGGLAKFNNDGAQTAVRQSMTGVYQSVMRSAEESLEKVLSPLTRGSFVDIGKGRLQLIASEADKSASLGDYFGNVVRSVVSGQAGDFETHRQAHERLTKVYKVERAMTEGTGTSLGYTTPVIYEAEILREAAEEQVFVRQARHIPLAGKQVEWPVLNQYAAPAAGQPSVFGGVQVFRKGENAQRTQSNITDKKVVLMAQDLTCMFRLSRDLDMDSTASLSTLIPALAGEAIGWRTDWECWQGTGTGMMMGIQNHPATILVNRNTSSHIKYQDVFAMYTRLLPRAKKGAAWYIHPFAMADIMALQDPSGRFIYLPVYPGQTFGQIGSPVSGTLLGLPVIETEKMSPLGTSGDLALLAMDRYLYGERAGLEIGLSEHFYYDTDELAIRVKLRNDGKPQLISPIYLADGSGSNQVSAFIVLN